MSTRSLSLSVLLVLSGCGGSESLGDSDAGEWDGGQDASTAFDSGPPEPCSMPGVIESVPCGACGRAERFCTARGTWAYGTCEGQGGCTPGTSELRPCGQCGSQMARCTAACGWEPIGACEGEGECAPGQRTRGGTGCPAGFTRDLMCSAACVYEGAGECASDACPTPGAIERVPCGACGMQDRFCTAAGVWEYGVCVEAGQCVPGTSRLAACGWCGTRVERCLASCTWDTSAACVGAGSCAPGESRRTSADCGGGQSRLEVCDDACTFQPSGPCEGGLDAGAPARGDAGCGMHLAPCTRNEDCCSGTCAAFPGETACFG